MLNQLWDGIGINAFKKGWKVIRNRREGLEHSYATSAERDSLFGKSPCRSEAPRVVG